MRSAAAVGGIALRFPSAAIAGACEIAVPRGSVRGAVAIRHCRRRPVLRKLALPRGHSGIGAGIRLRVAGPILELAASFHIAVHAGVGHLPVGSCSAVDAAIDPRGATNLCTAKAARAHRAVHRAD